MLPCRKRHSRLTRRLLIIFVCGCVMGAAGAAEAVLKITTPSQNSVFAAGTWITFTASCAMCDDTYIWEFWNIADSTIADGGSGSTLQKAFTIPGQYKAKVTATDNIDDPDIGSYSVPAVASLTFTIQSNEYTITITPREGGAVSGPKGKGDGIADCKDGDGGQSNCVETYGKLTDRLQGSQFNVNVEDGWRLLGWNVNGTFQPKLVFKKKMENMTLEPLFGRVSFVSMWETNNPANKICDPTLQDERPAMPSNMLYLVESPVDEKYHLTLKIETPLRKKVMYGVFLNGSFGILTKVPDSDGFFPVTGDCQADIIFNHLLSPFASKNHANDFIIRVGYDLNDNGILDNAEIVKLTVGAFRLSGAPLDNLAVTLTTQGVFDGLAATSEKTAQELHDEFVKTLQENVFETQAQLLDAVTRCIGASAATTYQTQILQAADASNKGIQNEPIVRGTSAEGYQDAKDYIDFAVKWAFTIPDASRILQVFRDGTYIHVSDESKRPKYLGAVEFNCFAEDKDGTIGHFSSWLPHHSGVPFASNGDVQLSYYLWDKSTDLAQKVGRYHQIVVAGREFFFKSGLSSTIKAYFSDKQVGDSYTFPSPDDFYPVPHKHESPVWVPFTTVDFDDPLPNPIFAYFDDVYSGVGRGQLVKHEAQFTVQKLADGILVTKTHHRGIVEDLYDFNRDAAGAGWRGATLQIGHGNGAYGANRTAGIIFRDRIEFDVTIDTLLKY